jgi:hypothetical protein
MTVQYLPPPRQLAPPRVAALRAELELFVARDDPAPPWWRRRRNITGGLVAVLIVATGGGTAAAYAYLHARPVTDKTSARCYTVPVYTPGFPFPGTTVASAIGGGDVPLIEDALDACASLWRSGELQLGALAVVDPGASVYPVPALVGCATSRGAAVVFPGPADTCNAVGLAPESPPAVRPAEALGAVPTAGSSP